MFGMQLLTKSNFLGRNYAGTRPRRFITSNARRYIEAQDVLAKETPIKVSQDGTLMRVEWSDSSVTMYHFLWLRDNTFDFVNEFGQKKNSIFTTPPDVEISRIELLNKSICVNWSDGVKSIYDNNWLLRNAYDDRNIGEMGRKMSPACWTSASLSEKGITEFDYKKLLTNQTVLYSWLRNLNVVGLNIVKNVPIGNGAVLDLAKVIGPIHTTIYGDLMEIRVEQNPSSLCFTRESLPPHQDFCFNEVVPGIQLMHCLKNAASGGGLDFIDGFCVLRDLMIENRPAYEVLQTVYQPFERTHNNTHFTYKRPIIQRHHLNQFACGIFWSPTDEAPLLTSFNLFKEFHGAKRAISKKIRDPKYSIPMSLAPGDAVIFNNRRAFEGDRHYQSAFVDLDTYWNRLRTLGRIYEPNASYTISGGNFV